MAFKLVAGYLQSFVEAKDEHTALQSLSNLQNVVTQEMSADEQGTFTLLHPTTHPPQPYQSCIISGCFVAAGG